MPTVTIYIRDEDYGAFLKLRDEKRLAEAIHELLSPVYSKGLKKKVVPLQPMINKVQKDQDAAKDENWDGPVYRDKKKSKI